jgi:undecaprenyl-diphosphatase
MPDWLDDARTVDVAVYAAIAGTDVPALDSAMRRLTRAADHSVLAGAFLGVSAAEAVNRLLK